MRSSTSRHQELMLLQFPMQFGLLGLDYSIWIMTETMI